MKICILTHTMPRFKKDTNSASFIDELARGLNSKGNKVDVLTPFDPEFKEYKRGYNVITYKYIWPDKLHVSGYSRVLKEGKKLPLMISIISVFMSLSALFHLIYLTKKNKYDVISAHWGVPNGFIAFLASFITKVPYSITIPGSDVYLGGKNMFFKITLKLACERAFCVISDSDHYLKDLLSLGIKTKHTEVIRYGVDTSFLKPASKNALLLKKLNIPKSSKIVLSMGRFVEKKGFEYLIEAMKKVTNGKTNIVLLIIGDGDLRKKYENIAKKLKIEKVLCMPGAAPFSDRNLYFNLADVFVMPSIKDSSGNIDASPVAMMDAMSCGVPVVATKYSGDKHLVDGVNTGYIVKEQSSEAISVAISKILKWKNIKEKKRKIRKVAVDNFSIKAVSQKYLNLYTKI